MSASDDGGYDTPSHTTLASDAELVETSLTSNIETSCPWPGGKYIIRETKSKLVIGLKNGHLGLYTLPTKATVDHDLGFYWNCVETGGWLGLRNTVSGRFIGYDDPKFDALSLTHAAGQSFCARQHPDGGYVLLFRSYGLLVSMKSNGEKLGVYSGYDEARWEFIRVGSL